MAELYSAEVAGVVRVLYGGSVKAGNIAPIMAQPDVDGALVGERGLDCTACQPPDWPTEAASSAAQRQVQLTSCDTCH